MDPDTVVAGSEPSTESGLVEVDYGDLSDLKLEGDWPNLKIPLSEETVRQLRDLRY